jgi:hypothetical protein
MTRDGGRSTVDGTLTRETFSTLSVYEFRAAGAFNGLVKDCKLLVNQANFLISLKMKLSADPESYVPGLFLDLLPRWVLWKLRAGCWGCRNNTGTSY